MWWCTKIDKYEVCSSFLRITLWFLLLTFFTKKRWYLSILFDGLSVITLPNDTSNKRRLMCIAECKSLGGPQSYLWLPLLIKLSVFWRSDRQRDFDRAKTNRDIGTWSQFCVKRHGNCILTLGFCTKVLDTFMIDYCHTIIGRVAYYMNICFQYYPEYPTWQYIKDGIVSINNDISYMRSQIIITRNHDDKITYFWIKF